MLDEQSKETLDVLAASTGVLSLAAWLPPVASLFTIVWLGIRIYESKTVQEIVNKKKQGLNLCLLLTPQKRKRKRKKQTNEFCDCLTVNLF